MNSTGALRTWRFSNKEGVFRRQLRKASDPGMGRSGKLQAWGINKLCKQYERVELGAGMVCPVQSSLKS